MRDAFSPVDALPVGFAVESLFLVLRRWSIGLFNAIVVPKLPYRFFVGLV